MWRRAVQLPEGPNKSTRQRLSSAQAAQHVRAALQERLGPGFEPCALSGRSLRCAWPQGSGHPTGSDSTDLGIVPSAQRGCRSDRRDCRCVQRINGSQASSGGCWSTARACKMVVAVASCSPHMLDANRSVNCTVQAQSRDRRQAPSKFALLVARWYSCQACR